MDCRDDISRHFFNQRIDFSVDGEPVFAGIRFDAPLAALLTGAIDGAVVTFNATVVDGTPRATFTVTHPLFAQPAERVLSHSSAGALILTNNDLRLNTTGTGLGVRMLAHQVQAARAIGVTSIELWAGAGHDAGRPLNGTWTWARCGFNGPLPYTFERAQKKLRIQTPRALTPFKVAGYDEQMAWLKAWPIELKDAQCVQDVMANELGRRWWKTCPVGCDLTFDLSDGSVSRRVLEAYLLEKAVNIGEFRVDEVLTSPRT